MFLSIQTGNSKAHLSISRDGHNWVGIILPTGYPSPTFSLPPLVWWVPRVTQGVTENVRAALTFAPNVYVFKP